MAAEWRNWAGGLSFVPAEHAEPEDEDGVRALIERARDSGVKIRPVGAGHSSSPLVRTDGILISLARLNGMVWHDLVGGRATSGAGARLRELGEGLHDVGLAMGNLGDVDSQTIAGAVATGTHGSGLGFGSLSTQVVGVRLITGAGRVVEVSEDENADLLPAARLSLGALGVLTRITLNLRPPYDLRRLEWCAHVDWTLDHLAQLQHTNRNMDFYWYPRSDLTQIRTLNLVEEAPPPPGDPLRTTIVGPSHRTIPKHRELRFEEMEYLLPSEVFPACFAEVRRRVKERHRVDVAWRLLVRTVAADDIALSPAYGRPTTAISCLQNASLPHEEYFNDMESVLRDHGGRPHWGKRHSLSAADLRPLYPEWDAFRDARRRLDPDDVLLSPDLESLLEDRE